MLNGKEADQLSRLNYYGYRYYDPLSLTWTQADPLFRIVPDLAYDQPRLMSLYAFSLNNPVRYLDPDGRKPNEAVYATRADASADFGKLYNDDSIRHDKEYSTTIYMVPVADPADPQRSSMKFGYTTPNRGNRVNSAVRKKDRPTGSHYAGSSHTHGANDPKASGSNAPSPQDRASAGQPGEEDFVHTSNGSHIQIGSTLSQDAPVDQASPYDVRDPSSPTGSAANQTHDANVDNEIQRDSDVGDGNYLMVPTL